MIRPRILPCLLLLTAASAALASKTHHVPTPSAAPVDTGASSSAPKVGLSSTSPSSYTTVKGDTLGTVAKRFACSARSLRKLNKLKHTRLAVGTILQIPAAKGAAVVTTSVKKPVVLNAKEQRRLALEEAIKATNKYRRKTPVAQPVQDFDIAPSEFASCPPTPSSNSEPSFAAAEDEIPATAVPSAPHDDDYPAPLAVQNVRGGLLPVPASLPEPPPAASIPESETASAVPTTFTANRASASLPSLGRPTSTAPVLAPTASSKKTFASAIADFFGGSHGMSASESGEWGNRFLGETRNLAAQGICYDGSWRPEGESHRWEMDCSNTTRYLYQVTAGIQLPRTASDQYYYLHLQDKAWDVPMTAAGFADCNFLRSNLKPGDLLFWENTYRPERQPPITHVMIFLGSDARGRWLMAGSQGSKGFYNRRHSGPDVYVFDPTHSVGGYTTWLGLVRHHGRFVAYGRPLEADVKKLSVAADD